MEIMSLLGGAAVPGQASAQAERSDGSGASAFAALFEGMQPAVATEEDVAPEASDEDIDEAEDSDDQALLDTTVALPVPALPEGVIRPAEEEVRPVMTGRATPPGIAGVGIDTAPASLPLGAVVQNVAAPDSAETALPGASTESADFETTLVAAPARESATRMATPAPSADLPPLHKPEATLEAMPPQPEDRAANQDGDKPEMTASFDLPDLASVSVSVHEGKAAATPPELHSALRAQVPAEARHVLRQMGEKLSEQAEGVVEIALSPEELGKVRLVIAPGEKPAVTVFADRPETFDLLRRHAETLDKELRNAGIFGADISFSGGNDGRERSGNAARDLRGSGQREQSMIFAEHAVPAKPRPIADRRIDIRI